MKSTITFTNNITVENYNALRAAVDWIQVTEKRASIALQHSFYLCVAMDGERPVGMARIVSDGGIHILLRMSLCIRTIKGIILGQN